MGFGDVKLAPLLAALAALAVPGGAVVWLVLAFLARGHRRGRVLIRRGTGARMPFGPPMLLGAWAVVLSVTRLVTSLTTGTLLPAPT